VIGDRLAMGERGAFVMIVSDHGFGRYEKNFYLNKVLEQHGLLHRERSARKVASRRLSTRRVIDAVRKIDVFGLEGRVPHRFREKLARGIDSALAVPIDMQRTLAYAAARSAESVFIADHVPESQRNEVASRVIEALEAARDPDTGEPIIDRAMRREDVYDGSELHRIPDILIDFGERPYVASDRLAASSIVERLPASGGGGRHRRYGILLALGPGVQPGTIEGANIVDLAPTALHAMGLPVPDDMDGRVLTDLFSDGRAVQTSTAASSETSEVVYTPEEEAAIEASLENLGYL
jgi:predicted AlkP superfamily phosphohydrolase/phosphomutase